MIDQESAHSTSAPQKRPEEARRLETAVGPQPKSARHGRDGTDVPQPGGMGA